jgi:ketosteroid isomerase-like protein
MNTELNKSVAIELFARFTASDLPGVLDAMTEDATWLIPGKPDSSPRVCTTSGESPASLRLCSVASRMD